MGCQAHFSALRLPFSADFIPLPTVLAAVGSGQGRIYAAELSAID
jgi:hypothetical protein